MTIWAIIPVKPLRSGKSRLAGTLTADERTELNRTLLQHTLKTLSDLKEVEHVLVISRDPQALTVARMYGARTVREDGQPHLNTASSVQQSLHRCMQHAAFWCYQPIFP